ncbi:DUF1302 family protein [Oceanobacter mangrovi]|uniref:DUF1302 family protein n=1 Tax=Oceanobacter mangrovi TaxID=2862510 RepID=UPI001C8E6DF2|nr:DUF1302 family protein [Oceanobacter mangrovi]
MRAGNSNLLPHALGLAVALGSLSMTASAADTSIHGFAENATYFRDGVGLSKFRNTGQLEILKPLETSGGGWYNVSVNAVLRATYDGVYDLNDEEFGEDAQQQYLGSNWHPNEDVSNQALTPGVPVPCENDPTLCNNLSGYMDEDSNDLRTPDFNDEWDFVRELYIDASRNVGDDQLSIRLGKQQVVWGRTDLFRVLDTINPVDYSRHNIYDELEDIRIPQWMLKADLLMGPNEVFDDMNFQLVWNFDKFRPNNLGTCGQSYSIVDAGCFFSSYIGFPDSFPVADYAGSLIPIIHDVKLPEHSLQNTQIGLKWEGVYGDATFSLNTLRYRQQMPSLHYRAGAVPGLPALDGVFDIHFPQVNLFGGSLDYYDMTTDATWRIEAAYTNGEELARDTDGHKQTDMARYVIGFDKNLMIPALGSTSAFLLSAQVFGQHVLEHESDMPDAEKNWTGTLLFKGFYMHNRLSPQLVLAHDVKAAATAIAPSISFQPDNHWLFNFGFNVKEGGNKKFPWSVAAANGDSSGQWEPLARFTNGPIGVANQEDEVQLTIRYGF